MTEDRLSEIVGTWRSHMQYSSCCLDEEVGELIVELLVELSELSGLSMYRVAIGDLVGRNKGAPPLE